MTSLPRFLVFFLLMLSSVFAQEKKPWKAAAGEEWKVADQADQVVKASTALDFSALFPPSGIAGQEGFAKVNSQGELVFEKKPNQPPRFLGYSCTMNSLPDYTPAEIELYAEQIQRAGYNLLRPHFLDMMLMNKSTENLVFNPEELDRWDRLSFALKKRGIYLYLDASSSSWGAFYAAKNPWGDEARAHRLGTRLYYDETARTHWKEGVKRLLEHVNPYTKTALKDEPQVVAIQLRNESPLNFLMSRKSSEDPGLVVPFRKWLKQRYGTEEKLKAAWMEKTEESHQPVSFLKAGEGLENVSLPPVEGRGPDSRDLQRFFLDLERETLQWMIQTVQQIGTRVPVSDLNVGSSLEVSLSRNALPLIDNHAYFYHPSGYYSPGATEHHKNPIPLGNDYYRWLAVTRHWGAPFFVSEWGHLFWNSHRHTTCLTIPAYASLQNWQMIAHFSDPIQLNIESTDQPIRRFRIHNDPALRASEYISAALFRRKDLRPSPHAVEIRVEPDRVFAMASPRDGIPTEINRLALLCGVGTTSPTQKGAAFRATISPVLSLYPTEGAEEVTIAGSQGIKDSKSDGKNRLTTLAQQLRDKKVLRTENRTNPDEGIYESDTGEILLNETKGFLSVSTPQTEAISLPAKFPEQSLQQIRIKNEGDELSFAVISLTTDPIASSSRCLVIVSTDALNTEMTFENEEKKTLVDEGRAPILMRVAQLQLFLKHRNPKKLKMWALAANGTRRDEIPLIAQADGISVSLHTGKLSKGPTPYFEVQEVP